MKTGVIIAIIIALILLLAAGAYSGGVDNDG